MGKKQFGYNKEKKTAPVGKKTFKSYTMGTLPQLEEIKDFPIADLRFRGIDKETTEFFRVRCDFHPESGKQWRVYFPVTKNNKLTGYNVCNLLFTDPDEDKWSRVGKVGVDKDLFGQFRTAPQGKRLYVCEGQFDTLAVWQTLNNQQRTKGEYIPNVVGISYGTANAAEHVGNNRELVDSYKQVVTVFDNDEATDKQRKAGVRKGREATSEVQVLLAGRGKYIKLPPDTDANEVQQANERDFFFTLMDLQEFSHTKITLGAPVELAEMLTPIAKGLLLDCFPMLMSKVQGLRPHEITTILAPPKTGKTSISRQVTWILMKELVAKGEKVCMAFLEDTKKKVAQSFAALEANVKLLDYRQDPMKYGEEPARAAYDLLNQAGMVITSDNGKVKPDEIVPLFDYAYRLGCRYFVFDHYSYVISGDTEGKKSERERIDNMLTDLECWVKNHPVHVLGIAHVTMNKAELAIAKRNATKKDEKEPSEPYWYRVTQYDGRGSNIFSQISANIWGVHKEFLPDGGNGRTQLDSLECREAYTGRCDMLTIPEGEARLQVVGREF